MALLGRSEKGFWIKIIEIIDKYIIEPVHDVGWSAGSSLS
jgi:hypothetical protein